MIRRLLPAALPAALTAALVAVLCVAPALTSTAAADGHPPRTLGPGDARVKAIKDTALIRTSKYGYVYIAGQQHSRLTVTYAEATNSLVYRDTGTRKLGTIPKSCTRQRVGRGISVSCTIPPAFATKAMFVQVWPRLGNDRIDGHTLPERFRVWVLADAGNDVVFCGAGDCFVNGAKGTDRIVGGAGNDFLRSGPGKDKIKGGGGTNRIS